MAEISQHRAFAETIFSRHQHALLMIVGHQQREDLLTFAQPHTAHTACCTPHRPHVFLIEPDGFATVRNQNDVLYAIGNLCTDQVIAFIERHGNDAGFTRIGKIGQRGLFDRAARRAHEDEAIVGKFFDRQDGADFFPFFKREHIDDRFTAAITRTLRHFIDAQPVETPAVGETKNRIVRVGDEQLIDEIVFLDRRRLFAAPAAPLRPIVGERLRFDVAAMRHRHHHILRRDEVFDAQIVSVQHDLRAARVTKLGTHGAQFFAQNIGNPLRPRQDIHQIGNFFQQIGKVGDDPVALQSGQALQAQIENRLRLRFGQQIAIVRQSVFQP